VNTSPIISPKEAKIAIAIYDRTHDWVMRRNAISLAMNSPKNRILRMYGL
jgi:hypothetical protein